jgi:hypothetical protein
LAEKYNCGKSQIQQILKNKQHLQEKWHQNGNKNMKRECARTFKEINELTCSLFESVHSRGLPIIGPLLQQKALRFANILKIENFKASNGWLNKFCARNNIVFRAISGESACVNQNDVNDWISRLPDIISNNEPRNIFNADETGLFFRAVPNKSLVLRGSQCVGEKKKQRNELQFYSM